MKLKLPVVKRRFRVPSRSEEGKWHIVELESDGKLYCDCVASYFRNECYHIKKVKEYLEKNEKEKRGNNKN